MKILRKWDFLVALYIFCIAVSELMGGKTFTIFHIGSFALNASVAIFLVPLAFSIIDVATEVEGRERGRSIVLSGLIVIILLIIFAAFAVAVTPSGRFASSEKAYDAIFGQSIRIAFASLIAFAVSEFADVAIFARLKDRWRGRFLGLRNNISSYASMFLDTVVFIVLAFYAAGRADNLSFLWSLILPYWLLKCCMSFVETPLVYAGVRWLKKSGE